MKHITGLATILCLYILPQGALAFSIATTPNGEPIRWANPALTYYLDPLGPLDISDGSDTRAIQESFDDWQAISCTALTFRKLGSTNNKNVVPVGGPLNNRNEVVWVNDSAWPFGQYVLGVTSPVSRGPEIIESDIAMNGYSQCWTTTANTTCCDVKSVMIHELGHFFGVQHVLYGYDTSNPPTMAPYMDPYGSMASLEQDDKNAACFLYPISGYYRCSNNDECPYVLDIDRNGDEYYASKIICDSSGYCSGLVGVTPASVEFGQACRQSSDCKSGNTCQHMNNGIKMCTTSCTINEDPCPHKFHCAVLESTGNRYCAPGFKTLDDGASCEYNQDCESHFCFDLPDKSGSQCRTACRVTAHCPDGYTCWIPQGESKGGCYPNSQLPNQNLPDETPCSYDKECASNWCANIDEKNICATACDPLGSDCPYGSWCQVIWGDQGRCVTGTPPSSGRKDASICDESSQCISGWCVPLFGTQVSACRTPCNLQDWECPWGMACISYGSTEYGVCMPMVDKKWIGEDCSHPEECVTRICWSAQNEEQTYCAMSCIAGDCPSGTWCGNGGALGPLCQKTPLADTPSPGQPTDTPSYRTPSSGGGCSATSKAPIRTILCILGIGVVIFSTRRIY